MGNGFGVTEVDQRRVISAGTMSGTRESKQVSGLAGCRDPVAVIQTRAKKVRDL